IVRPLWRVSFLLSLLAGHAASKRNYRIYAHFLLDPGVFYENNVMNSPLPNSAFCSGAWFGLLRIARRRSGAVEVSAYIWLVLGPFFEFAFWPLPGARSWRWFASTAVARVQPQSSLRPWTI